MICVDASVAVKWVLVEEHSAQAEHLLVTAVNADERIVAPPLLPFEVANILRKRMTRSALTLVEADQLLERFLAFPVSLMAPEGLYRAALRLSSEYQLRAVYDAHYVVVAPTLGCDLWTDDRRLLRAFNNELPCVRWIRVAQAG